MNQAEYVADLALARRLERAEGMANAEFVEARAKAYAESGAEWIEVAGAYYMYDGVGSPCTQTFGLGMFEPVTGEHLERIEKFFQERGAEVMHEMCPMVDGALVKFLNARGYRPVEFSSVLFRPIEADSDSGGGETRSIRARRAERGEEAVWARTSYDGWKDVAPELDDFISRLEKVCLYRPNSHLFLAEKDGEPVGAGGLSLFEGLALLAGACTIPKWRRQGAQGALLAERLRYGAANGCDVAMIVAAPGSATQRNAERQGFRIAYTRVKWGLGK